MAMDYLPIQASSVPCERVFSSSGETDTKRRNRLAPVTMEALQIIKYNVRGRRGMDFTDGLVTSQAQMTDDPLEGDMLSPVVEGTHRTVALDNLIAVIVGEEGEEDEGN